MTSNLLMSGLQNYQAKRYWTLKKVQTWMQYVQAQHMQVMPAA